MIWLICMSIAWMVWPCLFRDSFVTIFIYHLTPSGHTRPEFVRNDSFLCDVIHAYVTWLIHVYFITPSYVTWLIHEYSMTPSYVTWPFFYCMILLRQGKHAKDSYVTRLIHMRHEYVKQLILCIPRVLHIRRDHFFLYDTTPSGHARRRLTWRDSFTCDMTHACVARFLHLWRDTCIYDMNESRLASFICTWHDFLMESCLFQVRSQTRQFLIANTGDSNWRVRRYKYIHGMVMNNRERNEKRYMCIYMYIYSFYIYMYVYMY